MPVLKGDCTSESSKFLYEKENRDRMMSTGRKMRAKKEFEMFSSSGQRVLQEAVSMWTLRTQTWWRGGWGVTRVHHKGSSKGWWFGSCGVWNSWSLFFLGRVFTFFLHLLTPLYSGFLCPWLLHLWLLGWVLTLTCPSHAGLGHRSFSLSVVTPRQFHPILRVFE